jgi:hypothetical protein
MRREPKLISIAGDDGHGCHRQPPVHVQENDHRDEQADDRDGGRDERHLEEPGGRVHVAGQTGQDATRLHSLIGGGYGSA